MSYLIIGWATTGLYSTALVTPSEFAHVRWSYVKILSATYADVVVLSLRSASLYALARLQVF